MGRSLLAALQLYAGEDFALLRATQQAPTANLGHAARTTEANIVGI
jgi:hypothetical protein